MDYEISWSGPYGREYHSAATAAGAMAYVDHATLKGATGIEVRQNGVPFAIKDLEAAMIAEAAAAKRIR